MEEDVEKFIEYLDSKHNLVDVKHNAEITDFKKIGDNKRVLKTINYKFDAIVKDKRRTIHYIKSADSFSKVFETLGMMLVFKELNINLIAENLIFIVKNPYSLLYTCREKGPITLLKNVSTKDVLTDLKKVIKWYSNKIGREVQIYHLNKKMVRII